MRQVSDFVPAGVHASGRDLMELRLPDVRSRSVNERDSQIPVLAKAGRELKARRAAADDDHPVKLGHAVTLLFLHGGC